MAVTYRDEMTPREYQNHEWQKELLEMQYSHMERVKNLDIEAAKLEAKLTSWFKIPVTIIKLPVLILFGLAYVVSMFTKVEMPEQFWQFLR